MILVMMVSNIVVVEAENVWLTDKATGLVYDKAGTIYAYEGNATNLVVPAKIGKVTIKKIYEAAFSQNATLKSIVLPNGLTEIGDSAFIECYELTTVKLPPSLKQIGGAVFMYDAKLKNIVLPEGLLTIGEFSFADCKSITTLAIPSTVTSLEMGAFQGTSITTLNIPSKITRIEGGAFAKTPLKSVVIPKTVTFIGGQAFAMCPNLTSVTIPPTVTTIEHKVFDDSPKVVIYGDNGSAAQIHAANYSVKFSERGAAPVSTTSIIKAEAIAVPANSTPVTVTAKPSKTILAVNDVPKTLEAYTINGGDYFEITDLGILLADTGLEFAPSYDDYRQYMQLLGNTDVTKFSGFSKNDGKDKQAFRVLPKVYYRGVDVSNAISIYSINGFDYYKLADVMDIINCGIIKNTKTGVIHVKPSMEYEPLDSPIYAPVSTANATYAKVQKALNDAYLKGGGTVPSVPLTVPDNTTLYVPRGVTYGNGANTKIYLGTNSSFVVKGEWSCEYPDRSLFAKAANTTNAVYSYGFDPVGVKDMSSAINNMVFVSSRNNFEWGNIPVVGASIAYGHVENGVAPIILNLTRDKRDSQNCVYVYFHVKGGESFGHLFESVNDSIDLTPQITTLLAKNIGKKAVVDRINIQNANGVSFSKSIALPVNWTIDTSGPAPKELKTVNYSMPDYGNSLIYQGLSQNSYIAKVKFETGVAYQLISPKNKYTVSPVQVDVTPGVAILGESSEIALFTGKKLTSGKDAYAFEVSPLSAPLAYAFDTEWYPMKADYVVENQKAYLNYEMNREVLEPGMSHGTSTPIMVKYHKKGDPSDVWAVLYTGSNITDKTLLTGKVDLSKALTDLTNAKGSVNIDGLNVYAFETRDYEALKYPSVKYASVACDFATSSENAVKLGKDTTAFIKANTELPIPTGDKTSVTATFALTNKSRSDIDTIQISPANQNKWTDVASQKLWAGETRQVPLTYVAGSPLFDLKIKYDYREESITKGVDFNGIKAPAGGKIDFYSDMEMKIYGNVTNNKPAKPIKVGDFGTDTIDLNLISGGASTPFNIADFTLVVDDNYRSLYKTADLKLMSLSQTASGPAQLTIARYFDVETEKSPYLNKLFLYYKGYEVGMITVTN